MYRKISIMKSINACQQEKRHISSYFDRTVFNHNPKRNHITIGSKRRCLWSHVEEYSMDQISKSTDIEMTSPVNLHD